MTQLPEFEGVLELQQELVDVEATAAAFSEKASLDEVRANANLYLELE